MNNIEKDDEVLHNRFYEIIRGVDNLRMLLFEMGATPAFIVENLLCCDAESAEDYIAEMALRIERMRLAVDQLSEYDVDFSHSGYLYYFNREGHFISITVTALLAKDSDYDGECIAVGLSAIIPDILAPELHDAAKRFDWEASKRINEAITYVLTLLDKQKENPNG